MHPMAWLGLMASYCVVKWSAGASKKILRASYCYLHSTLFESRVAIKTLNSGDLKKISSGMLRLN